MGQAASALMLSVKNWRKFQHYQHRRPPWIKLHRELLDDYDFLRLPLASQALAVRLWLIASETDDGSLPSDVGKLAFRLHCSEKETSEAINALVSCGFLDCSQVASDALAESTQSATLEKSRDREESEKKKEKIPPPAPKGEPAFGRFVDVFNAAYERRVRRPILTKAEKQTLAALVAAHGEAGACCLPLLAWCHDKQQGGGLRLKQRVASHLLRDGSRGTFAWITLLERAESLVRPDWQYALRVWRIAKEFGLEEALDGFGCQPPDEPTLTGPGMTPEQLEAAKARGIAEWTARAKAEQGIA